MSEKNFMALKAAIYEMGLYFNQQPGDDRINAYAKALTNFTPQQVIFAFKQVINSGSAFFPSLAEILNHLRPKEISSEDIGNQVANEIIQTVKDFGSYQLKEAYEALSDDAKLAIGKNTSILSDIALSDRDQLPTMRAQLRGMAKASVESKKAKVKNSNLEKLGIHANVISISDKKSPMRSLDFSEFSQGPA